PVQAARRLGRAGQLGDAGQHGLHRRHVLRAERARVGGPAQVGQQPSARVPLRPRAGLPCFAPPGRGPVIGQRKAGDEPRTRSPPAAGTPAGSRPNGPAEATSAVPDGTQEMPGGASPPPPTPGPGTAPAAPSQPRPRASAFSGPAGPAAASLTNTTRPSAR